MKLIFLYIMLFFASYAFSQSSVEVDIQKAEDLYNQYIQEGFSEEGLSLSLEMIDKVPYILLEIRSRIFDLEILKEHPDVLKDPVKIQDIEKKIMHTEQLYDHVSKAFHAYITVLANNKKMIQKYKSQK